MDSYREGGRVRHASRLLVAALAAVALAVTSVGAVAMPASAAQEGDFTYEITGGIATITAYSGSATSLGIPTVLGGAPVRVIGPGAFENQTQLTGIAIGNVTTIGPNAFRNSGLTAISLTYMVQTIGAGAFQNSKLTSVTLGPGVTTIGAEAFRGNVITTLTIQEGPLAATIGASAFANNRLASLGLPARVASIGSDAFAFNLLTSLTIPNTVTSLGSGAFNNNRIASLSIGSGLASIAENAFAFNLLTSLTVPGSVTSIGNGAFRNNALTSLNLGNGVVTIGESAFAGNELTYVFIPNSTTTIQGYAFQSNKLTGISLGPGPTAIGTRAFANNLLTSVTIPVNVTTIGSYAFQYNKLTSLGLGNGVTTIEMEAFSYNLLTAVTIPSSVTSIGAYAFADNLLSSVTFLGNAPATSTISLGAPPGPTVYYDPSTTGWSNPWRGYAAVGNVNLFTIAYDLGGAADPGNPATFHLGTPTFTLNNPTRTGYTFAGWTGTGLAGPTPTVTIPVGSSGSRSYTATWSPVTYTLTYVLGRGGESGNPATYTVESSAITLSIPTRAGYTFLGWTGPDLDGPTLTVTIPAGSTGNRTYTATWELTEYALSYDLGGGAVSKNPDAYTITTPDFTLNNPTREGYTFAGWTGTDVDKPTTNLTVPEGSTGDREYTATWNVETYAIAYSLGGGTADNPTSYSIESLAFSLANPTRAGYTFAGWTGTGLAGPTLLVTVPSGSTGNRSYTANWNPVLYAISYDLDGGVAVGNHLSYTADFPAFTLNNPTKAGFVFGGWTGTGLDAPTLHVTIPAGSSGNRSYAATWVQPYTITYNLAGGTAADNPTTYTAESGAITLVNPARAGYTFAGWTGTGLAGATTPVTIPAGSVGDRTYTANWTPITYSLTYELGGGAATGNPATYTIESGAITLENPTRGSSVFTGWTGTGLTEPTMSVTIPAGSTGNRAYTATWAAPYTITYNVAGGTTPNNPSGYSSEDDAITLVAPSRAGYAFAGWTGTGLSAPTKVVTIPTGSSGNRAYTATWTIVTYKLTYALGGGAVTGNPTTFKVTSAGITLKNPTRKGYTFQGWTGTGLSGPTKTVTIPKGSTGNRTYTATWVLTTYKLTYALGGGTASGNPATYKMTSAKITLKAPKRSGYAFAGWTGTGLKKATKTVTIAKGSTGNRSFKATWKANTYKVKFNANKGTGKAPAVQAMTYGKAKALTGNVFKRSGYTFLGWSTSKTAKTATYKNKASVKNLTATNGKTVTLYAVWKKK